MNNLYLNVLIDRFILSLTNNSSEVLDDMAFKNPL